MELEVWNKEGKVVDTITLEDTVLSDEDYHLLYLSVKAYLDNQRLGTAKTKTRGEVRGEGENPGDRKELVEQDMEVSVLPSGREEE